MFAPEAIMRTILIALAVIAVLAVILRGYVKAPPDQAYIISGLKKECQRQPENVDFRRNEM